MKTRKLSKIGPISRKGKLTIQNKVTYRRLFIKIKCYQNNFPIRKNKEHPFKNI